MTFLHAAKQSTPVSFSKSQAIPKMGGLVTAYNESWINPYMRGPSEHLHGPLGSSDPKSGYQSQGKQNKNRLVKGELIIKPIKCGYMICYMLVIYLRVLSQHYPTFPFEFGTTFRNSNYHQSRHKRSGDLLSAACHVSLWRLGQRSMIFTRRSLKRLEFHLRNLPMEISSSERYEYDMCKSHTIPWVWLIFDGKCR